VRGILFAILYQSLRSVRRIHAVLHAALGETVRVTTSPIPRRPCT
jgi:hypothetical protein